MNKEEKDMAKQKFSYNSIQDVVSIKRYLKALIKSLEEGKISLSSGEDSIDFKPAGLLHFSVEARKKGRKNKLLFKLSWNDKQDASNDDKSKPMTISS